MELSFAGPAFPTVHRLAWRRRLRPLGLLLLSWILLAVSLWTTFTPEEGYASEGLTESIPFQRYTLIIAAAMLQIVAASAAIVVLHARTECLVHIAAILLSMWASEAALVVKFILQIHGLKDYGLAVAVSLGCLLGVGWGVQKTFIHNAEADIEKVLGMDMGRHRTYQLLKADLLLSVLVIVAVASQRLMVDLESQWPETFRIMASVACWAFLGIGIAFNLWTLPFVNRVIRAVDDTATRGAQLAPEAKASQGKSDSDDPDIQKILASLKTHRTFMLGLCLARLLVFGHIMLFGGFLWPIAVDLRVRVTDSLDETFAAYLLTDSVHITTLYYFFLLGVIWYVYGGLSSIAAVHARFYDEELRLLKRDYQRATFVPGSDSRWQAQVEDLACRAITIEALLDFYVGLGTTYMPSFTPGRHTTHDVVRQAIIPLSASAGSDLAKVLMKGRRLPPQAMVSHTWRGRFRDLVAAVVADSLGEQEYGRIGKLLDSNIDLIKSWITRESGLERTYWICAFSVNQHLSICSPAEPPTDSITGQLIPTCGCSCPKFLNTDEPCRADGASIHCEMNKFGDMMAWLAAKDNSFTHVLAMDRDLDLLTRAWCVAEAAESYIMGMCQYMKVSSNSSIRKKWAKVKKLRVEGMAATRPEDVDEILQRIPNKTEFNTQIQKLFGRLFGQFWHVPPSERVLLVCRELRWRMNMIKALSDEAPGRLIESQLKESAEETVRQELV